LSPEALAETDVEEAPEEEEEEMAAVLFAVVLPFWLLAFLSFSLLLNFLYSLLPLLYSMGVINLVADDVVEYIDTRSDPFCSVSYRDSDISTSLGRAELAVGS
jgi:hypothetical protein